MYDIAVGGDSIKISIGEIKKRAKELEKHMEYIPYLRKSAR